MLDLAAADIGTAQEDGIIWMVLRFPKPADAKTPLLGVLDCVRCAIHLANQDAGSDVRSTPLDLDWQPICHGGWEATTDTGHWMVISGPLCSDHA